MLFSQVGCQVVELISDRYIVSTALDLLLLCHYKFIYVETCVAKSSNKVCPLT